MYEVVIKRVDERDAVDVSGEVKSDSAEMNTIKIQENLAKHDCDLNLRNMSDVKRNRDV